MDRATSAPEAASLRLPHAPSATLPRGHLPSLDGLRAIAIVLVVIAHVANTAGSPVEHHAYWFLRGAIGVDVFFVISGFLITTLLLRERDEAGSISLSAFWKRRALRILPAYVAFLSVVAILSFAGLAEVPPRDWIASLTYTVNFVVPVSHPVAHLWSLSLEEHFYLAWPILFVLLGVPRAAKLLALALLAEPLIRWVTKMQLGVFDMDFATFSRYDGIAWGCLLAIAGSRAGTRSLLTRIERRPMVTFVIAMVVLLTSVFALGRSGKYMIFCYPLVNAAAICAIVWTTVRCPRTLAGRVLNLAPVAWVGRLSYSLYLWQQLFLDPHHATRWVCRFPQNLFLSFGAAVVSYYLIERPMLRFRRRQTAPTIAATSATESPMNLAA